MTGTRPRRTSGERLVSTRKRPLRIPGKLKSLARTVIAICEDAGAKPVVYGSLAFACYTRDAKSPIGDVDILVEEDSFPEIMAELKRLRITHRHSRKWHAIKIGKDDAVIELDARGFWQPRISSQSARFSVGALSFDAVTLRDLIGIYRRTSLEVRDTPARKKAIYKEKYERLRLIASR